MSEDRKIGPPLTDETHAAAEREELGGTENEAELHPPTQEHIRARLLLMVGLAERGFMEIEPTDEPDKPRQALVQELRDAAAWDTAEPWERQALECPVGTLDEKLQWKLPWQTEGAIVLAWSLQIAELPAYDQQVQEDDLLAARDRLMAGGMLPGVRTKSEIDQLAFQMLAIHWRLRQFYLERQAMDFAEYAPRAWCGPMDLSLARLIGGDLAVGGVPLAAASEESWLSAIGIMEERRKAVHWLLGHNPVYSENDTGT